MQVSPKRLNSLQALRGFAALAVAVMHCFSGQNGLWNTTDQVLHWVTMVVTSAAGAGVDLFFVISGFIITTVAIKSKDRGLRGAVQFLARRAARIYPLFWITLGGTVLLIAFYKGPLPQLTPLELVRVALLLTPKVVLQNPAWTLAYEVWFYAITALMLLLPGKWFGKGMAIWCAVQLALLVWNAVHVGPMPYFLRQPQILEFFFGCAITWAIRTFGIPANRNVITIIAVGAAILFAVGCVICFKRLPSYSLKEWDRVLFYGVPSALVVFALLSFEQLGHFRAPDWSIRLGDCSYSIYLWHFPVMNLMFLTHFGFFEALSPSGKASVEVLVTLAIAAVSYRLIERPTVNLAHRWTSGLDQRDTGVLENADSGYRTSSGSRP